jgi:hypothetical protein
MFEPIVPNPSDMTVHLLWINAGLSCDGDSVALTSATLPSVEGIVMGAIPGLPKVVPHWPPDCAARRCPAEMQRPAGRCRLWPDS